ncbi:MAG: globin [Bacteroidales bacterium]|nr:globin [Bacteroidales bacterium]MCF6341723.1 globin [Bacteroidales bacterium]
MTQTMQISKYSLIGDENIKKLVHDFYLEIRKDELLLPMYNNDLEGAEQRLYLFMAQYLGGPALYNEKRGHPRLKKRHAPFRVDEEAKKHWLENMRTALDKSAIPAVHKDYLWDYFQQTGEFLKNA